MKHINLICNHQSLIKLIILIDQYKYNKTKTIYIVTFTTYVQKKMLEQKRFAGRHSLTFESQKLNYFGKKSGTGVLTLQYNSLFRGDITSSNNNESAIFRRWKSNLKWRMFHRLNDKGDNSLTEIPGCPEKRIRIWAMSGPFSRFLVIFYSLSPCTPFQKCFSAHFHFCEQPR
jgi:hypothetical protein